MGIQGTVTAVASALLLIGCVENTIVPGEEASSSSTDSPTTTETTTSGEPTATSSSSTGVDGDGSDAVSSEGSTTIGGEVDEELCLQVCLNGNSLGCSAPWSGEECYTFCLGELEGAQEEGCLAEQRDVNACEGQASELSEPACETYECEDEYKRRDMCRGYCAYLGGYPGGGSSQTECDWRGGCYGHEFEVVCPAGEAEGPCECWVDERIIATCDHGAPLTPFVCDESIHIFTSCCAQSFEGVLFP